MESNTINLFEIGDESWSLLTPKVSIIVATYRRSKELKRALISLMQQTYKNIEVIVVDDNSDARWNKVVEGIVNCVTNEYEVAIKYIQNSTNQGSANTRNIGINKSQGEYITFLDDDDLYLSNKVENQVRHMLKEKSEFSITDLYLYNEQDILVEKRTRNYIKDYESKKLIKYHILYHLTGTDVMMFKRKFLIDIGGFNPIDVGDEFYLMLKAIESKGKFSYLSGCDVKAYIHYETQGLSSGDKKITGENELYIFKSAYFKYLSVKEIKYVRMRHNAVLAFAEVRRKNYIAFLKHTLFALSSSPFDCVKLVINRAK